MTLFSADRAMVAKFDAAIQPFMSKVNTMSDGVKRFQLMSTVGFGEVESKANATGRALVSLRAIAAGLGTAIGAGIGAVASSAFVQLADQAKSLENQMRGIGAGSDDTRKKIYALAIETRTPISDTVGLLSRMQKSLQNQPLEQTIRQVGTLNRLLTIGGLDNAARGSVALQFGQALQSGVLQGDELRSLREAAPYELLDAIAKAAGGTVEQLRDLGSEGKITRDVMVKALDDLEKTSREKLGNFKMTVAEAADSLHTALIASAGSFDEGLGLTAFLARAQQGIAEFVASNTDAARELGKALRTVTEVALLLAGSRGVLAVGTAVSAVTPKLLALSTGGLSLARTMRGLMALMGGPVGVAIFGLGAAFMALKSHQEAVKERTARVNDELEKLGLVAPKAADSVDEVGKAVDRLAKDERIQKLKDLREELDRLRSGGSFSWLIGADGDTLKGISDKANYGQVAGGRAAYGFLKSDNEALAQIKEIADGFAAGQVSLDALISRADDLRQMDLSRPALELLDALEQVAKKEDAVRTAAIGSGAIDEVSAARDEIARLVAEMTAMGQLHGIDTAFVEQVQSIVTAAEDGKISAEEARTALAEVADANPDAAGYLSKISSILAGLGELARKAATARIAVASAVGGYSPDLGRFPALTAETAGIITVQDADSSTIHPKKAPSLLGETGDKISGGGRSSRTVSDYEQTTESIKEETEAMRIEAQIIAEVTDARGADATAMEFARKKAELLTAAKKSGVKLTPEVIAAIESEAQAYAAQSVKLDNVRQKMEEVNQASEAGADALTDIFGAVLDGAGSAEEAVINLLKQIAQVQFAKGALGFLGGFGTSISTVIGGALTFAKGGIMTAQGSVDLPIRAYANGGVANSAQVAIFGEGSTAEAYVPLPDGRSIPVSLDIPDLSGLNGVVADRAVSSVPQVIYVPQPYMASLRADDDGTVYAQMQQIGDSSAAKATSAMNKALPARVQKIMTKPRER